MIDAKKPEQTLTEKANAAFQEAADDVIQRAKQTGTPIVVWEDNQIKELTVQEAMSRRNGAADQ